MMQIEGLVVPRELLASDIGTDEETARIVAERLTAMTAQATRVQRRFSIAAVLTCLGATLGLALIIWGLNWEGPVGVVAGGALCAGSLIVFCGAFIALAQDTPTFDAAEIAKIGGVKAIPPLFAALQSPLREAHEWAIYRALTMLLPLMTGGDANLLSLDARRTISKWLDATDSHLVPSACPHTLRIAALKALAQVGYSRDVPLVERLANIPAQTTGQAKVQQAAIHCLPLLRANCGGVEATRTLLRALQQTAQQTDALLRPASGVGQTDAAELVRSAMRPDAKD